MPFDPTVVGTIAAVKQRGQILEELRRLEGKQGATDDNKAEIKELKGNQNLLFEVSTKFKDLDERLKDDEQLEVAAKEFIVLCERTNFDWVLGTRIMTAWILKSSPTRPASYAGRLSKNKILCPRQRKQIVRFE